MKLNVEDRAGRILAHGKRSHGVERVAVDFCRNKGQNEVGNATQQIRLICTSLQMDSRADIECAEDGIPAWTKGKENVEHFTHYWRCLVLQCNLELA